MRKRVTQEQRNDPDYTDSLQNLKQDILKSINCIQVGEIQSFNASRQTVSVQVSIKQIVDIANDGTRRLQDLPLLLECPMMFLSGGNAHLTIPPQVGDGCIVLFNDRDIDNWFIEGGRKAPNTLRKHDLSDAIVIVGVRNLQTALGGFLEDAIQLQWNSTNKIEIKNGAIDSAATLWTHTGNTEVSGNHEVKGGLIIGGTITQETGAPLLVNADVTQQSGKVLKAGNGATGSFTTVDGKTVTVADGIVTSIV